MVSIVAEIALDCDPLDLIDRDFVACALIGRLGRAGASPDAGR